MLLLDNSAWARLAAGNVPQARRDEIADMLQRRELATSFPFLLEVGYSARNHADHATILAGLRQLPHFAVTDTVENLAIRTQSALAANGHHRVSPADLIIATLASAQFAGVLHYDKHYDVIQEHSDLEFESVWLSPPGSL